VCLTGQIPLKKIRPNNGEWPSIMTLFCRHHKRVQSPAQVKPVIHEMFGRKKQKKNR
jgi:hypothetical protein